MFLRFYIKKHAILFANCKILFTNTKISYSFSRLKSAQASHFSKLIHEKQQRKTWPAQDDLSEYMSLEFPTEQLGDIILSENDYTPSKLINELQTQWSNESADKMLESFQWLSNYADLEKIDISSNIFDEFIDALTDNIQNFSNNQLEIILVYLAKWPKSHKSCRNFIEVWSAIDDVLINRANDLDISTTLLFIKQLYKSKILANVDYMWKASNILCKKAKNLTDEQLIEILFYIGVVKNPPHDFHNFQVRLKYSINSLSLKEIATISYGFTRCNKLLRDPEIVEYIIDKLTKESRFEDDFTIISILPLLNVSANLSNVDSMNKMIECLVKEIPRLSLTATSHIALAGTKNLVCKPDLELIITHKLIDNISKSTLKDFHRILEVFSKYNLNHKCNGILTDAIIKELRSSRMNVSINMLKSYFIDCLCYMAILGVFPYDLINQALDHKFLHDCYKKNFSIGLSALSLDCSVEVECPDYGGSRMERERRYYLSVVLSNYIPEDGNEYKLKLVDKIFLNVITLTKKIRGEQFMYTGFLLPGFKRADIVICNTHDGVPVNIQNDFPPKHKFGRFLKAPNKNGKWVSIIIAGQKCFALNTGELLGTTLMKIRQLKKIGYLPVVINAKEWLLLDTEENKIKYLKDQVISVGVEM